jgi:hypothetical protein
MADMARPHDQREPNVTEKHWRDREKPDQTRPFPPDSILRGADLETLHDWLCKHGARKTVIGGEYCVGDLIADLNEIQDGMWNDGISAMGEDA